MWSFSLLFVLVLSTVFAVAQDSAAPSATPADGKPSQTATPAASSAPAAAQGQASGDSTDPLKRPLTEKQKKASSKALKQELSSTYKKWLNEDVIYIITPEEKSAFKQLSNDEERDQFIEQFWLRRDPTPDTPENEYKEEHYRRIAYANEHFAAGKPGWKTDRGRIYIMWGPPDQIDTHPSGGTYDRPQEEGGGTTSTYPFEDWRYRYLEGVGQEVNLEFVDPCMCGDFHLATDPNEKDALLHTPGGATQYEQMGLSSKTDRMDPFAANPGTMQAMQNTKEFDKLEMLAKVQGRPAGQVQRSGGGRQPQDQRQLDALRSPHRLREDHRRHGAGSRDPTDQEQGHHLRIEGRHSTRYGQHLRSRDGDHGKGRANL